MILFHKSIILIVDESDNSHTGFILNKPGGLFFLKNESGKLNRNYKFSFGGPVSGETFFIIKNHNLYSQNYKPVPENIKARNWFQDARFGLFVHWGVYSILGDGEWVMNNQNISIDEYEKLPAFFNPIDFSG